MSLVSVDQFATYLGNDDLDYARAQFIIDLAETLCQTVVSPLPTGAEVVVLDVAERAFANPAPSRDTGLGYYTEGEGAFSGGTPGMNGGGLFLTETNTRTLRQLAGKGGAFMLDMTPVGAGQNLPWWDVGNTAWPFT